MNKLKQAIIEKIHGLPWEEAKWIEYTGYSRSYIQSKGTVGEPYYGYYYFYDDRNDTVLDYHGDVIDDEITEDVVKPITLSRVLQAIDCMKGSITFAEWLSHREMVLRHWKPLKEDKSTAELDDQSEVVIKGLKYIFNQ